MAEKSKGLKHKLISSLLWSGGSNLILFFVAFGGSIVLARLILPKVFGQFAYSVAIIEMCALVAGIGTSSTIIQNNKWPDSELAGAAFFLNLVFIGIYILVACLLGWFLFETVLVFYLFLLSAKLAEMLTAAHVALVVKNFKFKQQSKVNLITTLFALLIAVLLAYRGYGLWGLATQYAVMKIFMAGAMIWISRGKLKYNFRKSYIKTFLANGKHLWVLTAVEKVRPNLAPLIISNFLNLKLLGLYNRGLSLVQRFSSLTFSLVQQVFLASFSEIQSNKNKTSLLFNSTAFVLIRVTTLISLLLACLSKELIVFFYGENWLPAASVLKVTAFYTALLPLTQLCRIIHLSTGRFEEIKYIQIVQVFLFTVTALVGVTTIGITGVAWALNISTAAVLFLYLLSLQRFVDLKRIAVFGVPLASGMGYFILFSWVKEMGFIPKQDVLKILILAPVIVVCYLLIGIIFERKQWVDIWLRLR